MNIPFRLAIIFRVLFCLIPTSANAWEALRTHPQNPYILKFREEPTVLLTYGEHYSSVINSAFDFIPYLDILERDGMNLTRSFLVGFRLVESDFALSPLSPTPANFVQPWLRKTTNGNALDSLGKWDFTAWNEIYFTRLKAFAQACSDRGIVVELTFFCSQYDNTHWQVSPFNPANNMQGFGPASAFDSLRPVDANLFAAQEAVVRRIVREVNGFDNIYFEIVNEPFWDEPGVKDAAEADFHNRMLAIIRDEESRLPNRHLVAHNYPQQLAALSTDFDVINEHYPAAVPTTTIAGAEALLRDQYWRGRILSLDETNTTSPTQSRLESWMFILGGGGIYNGLDIPSFIYNDQNESGDNAFGRASRGAIRNLATYVAGLNLIHLRRNLTWVNSGLPAGATLQAMSQPDQQYVAYLHHGRGSLTPFQLSYQPIDNSNKTASPVVTLPPGTWQATWTRPVDLVELRNEVFTHLGGTRTLAAVSYQEDVVLRIDRIADGPNLAPVANADNYTVQQNLQLIVAAPGVNVNDTDAPNTGLTASLDSSPVHGILTFRSDGSFTYLPSANYTGPDSFTYHVNDGSSNSNIATVTLTVTKNAAPSFTNGSFESGYTGWTRTGNQLIQSAPTNQIPEGIQYVSFNSGQTAPNGILAQTFSTTPGKSYLISFHVGILSYNFNEQRIQVDVTGTTTPVSETFAISGSSDGSIQWFERNVPFTAAGTAATLTFRDKSLGTNSLDLLLDHVMLENHVPPVDSGGFPMIPLISGNPENLTIQLNATLPGIYFLESSESLLTWTKIAQIEMKAAGPLSFQVPPDSGGISTTPGRMFFRIGWKSN